MTISYIAAVASEPEKPVRKLRASSWPSTSVSVTPPEYTAAYAPSDDGRRPTAQLLRATLQCAERPTEAQSQSL